MGYYISLNEVDFVIKEENLDSAYSAMCALNQFDKIKRGGGSGIYKDHNGNDIELKYDSPRPDGMRYHPGKWFSWMDANYPEICKTAEEIIQQLGFDYRVEENGDLRITGYDNKTGQEYLFLAAIASYVENESYMVWSGEDHHLWKLDFFNGKMYETIGEVVFNKMAAIEITWDNFL